MKKISSREWTILLSAIVVLALLALATSISSLTLKEGRPLPLGNMAPDLSGGGSDSGWISGILAVFRVVMIIFWVLLPVYLVYLIISKEARRRLLRDLLIMLPILAFLYLISNNISNRNMDLNLEGRFGGQTEEGQVEQLEAPPLPEFQPPPAWVGTAASLVLATVVVLMLAGVVYFIWRRSRIREGAPLYRIETRAREAILSIEAGGDLSEVIQRCYLQMVEAIRETMSIYRSRDMTPHEFELVLEQRGLPREPVHQLTLLFEQVRYGGVRPGRADERAAIASLTAIVNACQRVKERQDAKLDARGE